MINSRRKFIQTAAIGSLAAISIPKIVSAAMPEAVASKVKVNPNDVILFQGDSITDAGRDKTVLSANTDKALGGGYAFVTASQMLMEFADKKVQVYNKGISGNKVFQLADRWDTDCLTLKPNVLSILVGVNDFWHTLTNGYKGTPEIYKADYIKLLDRTKQALPDVKLIIGEPFAVLNVKAVDEKWYPAFNEYRQIAKEIAEKYDAAFIPYQQVFDKAIEMAPGGFWTRDGVHPALPGYSLMAHAWLKTVKG